MDKKNINNKLLAQKFIDELAGAWPIVPLNNYSLFIFGSGYNTEKYFGGVYKEQTPYAVFDIRFNGETQTFLPETVWKEYVGEVFKDYLRAASSISKREKNFYLNFPLVDDLYQRYSYSFIALQKESELLPIALSAFDLIWTTNAWSHFSVYFDIDYCCSIVAEIYPQVTREEIEAIWHEATEMVDESFDKAQKRDVLNYLLLHGNDNNLVEHCQYFYTSYRRTLSLEEVKAELLVHYSLFLNNPSLAQLELKKMDEELAEKKQVFKLWRQQLNPLQKKIADFCQIIMRVRDQRKNHFAKGITVAWRIAEKIFTLAKVDKSLIENVLIFEELGRGSKYIAGISDALEQRNTAYALYIPYQGDKEIMFTDIKAENDLIQSYYMGEQKKSAQEIKGQIGNKGLVSGRVRIIKSSDKFNTFKEGEILVTGMTRPEYVPLMHKALAIITDEGGITCHAAIISRELNKPCIIGTRMATQILKDGDLVEVDAINGMIKIIKS